MPENTIYPTTIGERVDIPFNANDFSGTHSMLWTVEKDDVHAFWYCKLSLSLVLVTFAFHNTTIVGEGAWLLCKLPTNILPTGDVDSTISLINTAAHPLVGISGVFIGENEIQFGLGDSDPWTAGSGNVHVGGQIIYPFKNK